jgi:hypothetical protein
MAPDSCCQPGQRVVISDGVQVKVVDLKQPLDLGDKTVRESVFSAQITAYKL